MLVREGVLVAADHVLDPISPTVGLWPASRSDPLGDYLESLDRTIELAAQVALPGHGEVIRDPSARARELKEHHRIRLEEAVAALAEEPRSGYELSLALWGADLKPAARRFAVAESLSHAERLVRMGAASRHEDDRSVSYTAA
jgi:glyoxylase-like metal-dependent hydrolase (beta-lactamase superfamily II)